MLKLLFSTRERPRKRKNKNASEGLLFESGTFSSLLRLCGIEKVTISLPEGTEALHFQSSKMILGHEQSDGAEIF